MVTTLAALEHSDFETLCRQKLCAGQRELANAMRALTFRAEPELYERLSEADDHVFLEPLLFAYFRSPGVGIGLSQILFGYLPDDARPTQLAVRSDLAGRVHLPNVGHLCTRFPDDALTLLWCAQTRSLEVRHGSTGIAHIRESPVVVPGTAIQLVSHSNALLEPLVLTWEGESAGVLNLSSSADLVARVASALEHIRLNAPRYFQLLSAATRQIAVFDAPRVNSFATLNAHGVAFLNIRHGCSEAFFIDELTHQCGHNIFNAISVRRREYFRVDPDAALNELTPAQGETRTLYTALHGLFTEEAMCRVLRAVDERQSFTGPLAHELRGRLAFIAQKFPIDIRNLSAPGLFTPQGDELFNALHSAYEALKAQRPELFELELGDQPYNFDHDMFAAAHRSSSLHTAA